MPKLVDLHIHSTASDGEDSPETLVQIAKKKGLRLISITDHDSVSALERAQEEAKKHKINFVSGVELSVVFRHPLYRDGKKDMELHLLGYRFDQYNAPLIKALQEISEYRVWRATEVIKKVNSLLSKQGQSIISPSEFDALQKAVEGSFGRPHLAQLLVKKGIVTTRQEAFDRYLVDCNVPKKHITLQAGAQLIRDAGGFAVLAHPYGDDHFSLKTISDSISIHLEVLKSIRDTIDGIECYYWNHQPYMTRQYVEISKELDLIITAGSDHHGGSECYRLGQVNVPLEIVEHLRTHFQSETK